MTNLYEFYIFNGTTRTYEDHSKMIEDFKKEKEAVNPNEYVTLGVTVTREFKLPSSVDLMVKHVNEEFKISEDVKTSSINNDAFVSSVIEELEQAFSL